MLYITSLKMKEKVKSLSRVQLFATSRTVAYQAPLSMGLYVPSTYLSYNWKSVLLATSFQPPLSLIPASGNHKPVVFFSEFVHF